ncbi:hypothetical protein NDU88_002131 [Pleurodeles waltl]|uniref:Uncharacterized protein n=1 Tax=Pleurodeles waltl TaxID=8319 RepID=A0AAV7KUH7_PLEWA|nr:hypothetical protein NDU88_002131 [Pleurodeles waltl]
MARRRGNILRRAGTGYPGSWKSETDPLFGRAAVSVCRSKRSQSPRDSEAGGMKRYEARPGSASAARRPVSAVQSPGAGRPPLPSWGWVESPQLLCHSPRGSASRACAAHSLPGSCTVRAASFLLARELLACLPLLLISSQPLALKATPSTAPNPSAACKRH